MSTTVNMAQSKAHIRKSSITISIHDVHVDVVRGKIFLLLFQCKINDLSKHCISHLETMPSKLSDLYPT